MRKLTLGLSALALASAGTAFAAQHGDHKGPEGDGNGVVTRAEAQAHATAMFTKMDFNSDGKIDEADRAARKEERRTKMFAALDADGNGQVSRTEFMEFKHEGRGDGKKGHRMGKRGHHRGMMMKMADTDNDGAISQAELAAASLKRFDAMDADKDGQVTKEERKAAFKEMRGKWRDRDAS